MNFSTTPSLGNWSRLEILRGVKCEISRWVQIFKILMVFCVVSPFSNSLQLLKYEIRAREQKQEKVFKPLFLHLRENRNLSRIFENLKPKKLLSPLSNILLLIFLITLKDAKQTAKLFFLGLSRHFSSFNFLYMRFLWIWEFSTYHEQRTSCLCEPQRHFTHNINFHC